MTLDQAHRTIRAAMIPELCRDSSGQYYYNETVTNEELSEAFEVLKQHRSKNKGGM